MINIRELAVLFDDMNRDPALPSDNVRIAAAREQQAIDNARIAVEREQRVANGFWNATPWCPKRPRRIARIAAARKQQEKRVADGFWRPTTKSLPYIEKRLRFKLPANFLDFASASNSYSEWFLSLGEDYTKSWHILNVAAETKRIRRRKNGRWQNIKPKSLIPITIGHDGDYDCFDISRPGPFEGEFEICYWSTPMTEGSYYELDFSSYILKLILYWSVGRRCGKEKEHYTHIYERTCTMLEEHENNILEALYGKV